MTLWNILAFCVVIPSISPYPRVTNLRQGGHIRSVAVDRRITFRVWRINFHWNLSSWREKTGIFWRISFPCSLLHCFLMLRAAQTVFCTVSRKIMWQNITPWEKNSYTTTWKVMGQKPKRFALFVAKPPDTNMVPCSIEKLCGRTNTAPHGAHPLYRLSTASKRKIY